MKKWSYVFCWLLAGCFCVPAVAKDDDDDKPDYVLIDAETATVFPRVEEPLTLQLAFRSELFIVKHDLQSLTPKKLTFLILNLNNMRQVTLNEWFQNETDNLRLYVAPISKAGEKVPADRWKQVWPEKAPGKKAKRQPVAIAPGNRLMLDIPAQILLPFMPKKKVGQRLAVKAELNLRSVTAAPLLFEVVLRKEKGRVKQYIFAD